MCAYIRERFVCAGVVCGGMCVCVGCACSVCSVIRCDLACVSCILSCVSGRTDKKINREETHEANDKYRSHVGTLNWLTMGLRYDIAFVTKELSRVLDQPTRTANEISHRALVYAYRTKHAHLRFSHNNMTNYTPPKTRKKPHDHTHTYAVEQYNTIDGITHVDETTPQQDYIHTGK